MSGNYYKPARRRYLEDRRAGGSRCGPLDASLKALLFVPVYRSRYTYYRSDNVLFGEPIFTSVMTRLRRLNSITSTTRDDCNWIFYRLVQSVVMVRNIDFPSFDVVRVSLRAPDVCPSALVANLWISGGDSGSFRSNFLISFLSFYCFWSSSFCLIEQASRNPINDHRRSSSFATVMPSIIIFYLR